MLHALERKGVYVSTGSACSSKKRGQSHVLEQLPLEKTYMEGTIRFSFSRLNTLEEIQTAIKQIVQEVEGLRKFARRR
nr:aminotransferase class V-fold PLP-dependent enzyme [Alkalibacter rhizosphaerae]